jgi:serine O-acetyltransferase
VVIHDVPPNSTVVGNPGRPVRVEGRRPEGPDADWVHLPDPIADAIKSLSGRISALEDGAQSGSATVRPLRPALEDGEPGDAGASTGPGRSMGPNPAGG